MSHWSLLMNSGDPINRLLFIRQAFVVLNRSCVTSYDWQTTGRKRILNRWILPYFFPISVLFSDLSTNNLLVVIVEKIVLQLESNYCYFNILEVAVNTFIRFYYQIRSVRVEPSFRHWMGESLMQCQRVLSIHFQRSDKHKRYAGKGDLLNKV